MHENSGDWVVYFNSSDELDSFQKILEDLWDEDKKVSSIKKGQKEMLKQRKIELRK